MNKNILITLGHGVVIPTLSRQTGAPSHATETRWLIVQNDDSGSHLVGCLDVQGDVFRTAVRENVRLQERSLVNARTLKPDDPLVHALDAAAEPDFNMSVASMASDYRSVSLTDALNGISAWPSENGDTVLAHSPSETLGSGCRTAQSPEERLGAVRITVRMAPACGMLVPASDPITPPFRHVGLLWPNGDFALNAADYITSFASSAGVIFAAAYPDELAMRFMRRNNLAWGRVWLPEEPSEAMKHSAARIAEVFTKRGYVPLTPELIKKRMGKKPGSEALTLKHGAAPAPVIWKNGLDESGKPFNVNDPALAKLFAPLLNPVVAE